ncbi:MAG: putative sporulation protein YtxC [Negativicutes bacterium]|nr:putative sporulation protein YtxC [Negativicutes bacterium]
MKLLSIGLAGTTDDIRARLQQDCRSFATDGFRIAVDEISKGTYTFLGCNLTEGELSFYNYERIKSTLKNYVAKILADIVVLREEKRLVRKIIDTSYYYFSESERDTLFDSTLQILNSNNPLMPDFNFTARHTHIQTKIQEYLETNHELVLEGFIQFRLKSYREQLRLLVDKVVDEFVLELEYKEFIRVLRYFVDVQEPRIDEVHIVLSGENTFKLLDKQGKPVKNQHVDNILMQNADEINYEDLLVSALISLAPHHIIIHNKTSINTQELAGTIESVFEDRVALCDSGCAFCNTDIISPILPR